MGSEEESWWSRPCGGREVLAIALPLFISTGAWSVMLFVDRMFLLWHSPEAMAASTPAGMLYWAMICFPMGVAGYVNTFVAQYHGAKQPRRIGQATWQGIRVGMYVTPLFLGAIPLAPTVFGWAGHDADVVWLEVLYFQVLTFGAGAAVLSAAQAAFFTGRSETRCVMLVNVSSVLINILLDFALIFGKWGFPEMGMEGAAWATVASQWFKVLVFAILMCREPVRLPYHLGTTRDFDFRLFGRLIWYGGPAGLQFAIEGISFAFITLLVGRFGKDAMIATTLAFNVNSVVFVPMLGVGIATSTLVGQQLTSGRPDLASRATWTSIIFVVVYTSSFGLLYVLTPDLFLMGHAAQADPDKFLEVRPVAVMLLRFVAAFCVFDSMNIVFAGAIKGAGDTWFVLLATLVISATGVTVCWVGLNYGLFWWWTIVTIWVSALGVTFLLRFLQGKWRTMRVIEHRFVENA